MEVVTDKIEDGKLKTGTTGEHKFFFNSLSKLILIFSTNKYSIYIKIEKIIKLEVSTALKAWSERD